jgi:hypothetical protein
LISRREPRQARRNVGLNPILTSDTEIVANLLGIQSHAVRQHGDFAR